LLGGTASERSAEPSLRDGGTQLYSHRVAHARQGIWDTVSQNRGSPPAARPQAGLRNELKITQEASTLTGGRIGFRDAARRQSVIESALTFLKQKSAGGAASALISTLFLHRPNTID